MIFGVYERCTGGRVDAERIQCFPSASLSTDGLVQTYVDENIGFWYCPPFEAEKYKALRPVANEDGGLAAVFTGQIYNVKELMGYAGQSGLFVDGSNVTFLLLDLYKKLGIDFLTNVNGKFAVGIWDKAQQRLILARDHMGIEPVYYYIDEKRLVFSSSIDPIFRYTKMNRNLNHQAIGKFLLFNYNPGMESLFSNINKLRPAHALIVGKKDMKVHRYWKLSFDNAMHDKEEEISETLTQKLRTAVKDRIDIHQNLGIFLSGGMDSSTVLTLAKESLPVPPETYSYRCRSESFDESKYARMMARHTGASHHEIEYTPADVLLMPEVAREMCEPFCDVGINIATYLLGREANRNVSLVMTGDGGDELFAGHPVYEADKVAGLVEKFPGTFVKPIIGLMSLLPDSDQKKNITVKIKRFCENFTLPRELLSHRWRIYYHLDQIGDLLTDSFSSSLEIQNLFKDIFTYSSEIKGINDPLSRSIYSDYQTVVDFYLRRNDLIRKFQIDMHYPLLDYRLVEYCASIPSRMKINGWFDTKYIFKKSMEKILPREIVHRKDKLGHSIPLKNWIRDKKEVRDFVLDYLSETSVRNRGFFRYPYVKKLVDDHMKKKRNNSHRIWGLAVLEMWLREHYDRPIS
jgi:asparagine synthase (glutamine-hydrolysing)